MLLLRAVREQFRVHTAIRFGLHLMWTRVGNRLNPASCSLALIDEVEGKCQRLGQPNRGRLDERADQQGAINMLALT